MRTGRRIALGGLVAAMLGILSAFGISFAVGGPTRVGAYLMGGAIPVAIGAMVLLGTAGTSRRGRLVVPLLLACAALAGCFLLALGMPVAGEADVGLWLGLPPRAAVILYGVGLIPLLVLPILHAVTFADAPAESHGATAAEEPGMPEGGDAIPQRRQGRARG